MAVLPAGCFAAASLNLVASPASNSSKGYLRLLRFRRWAIRAYPELKVARRGVSSNA
jgi:hypothetical protein